ncbi:MAG TPA: bifunctional demethylmenaquinone methyltransferase/2-methoxy-6-polyprenyl-1,4-benzoquinol methylase UbiE [Candidatus Dormibacteraeota bacterium]|nr:bifunctional demethylmenaquinone methyltransferase/2-methoxy-6-polyprenyl-1,4-benzoquinol methylase UbiE [Candidatus Dormibacteraeota bacterium]
MTAGPERPGGAGAAAGPPAEPGLPTPGRPEADAVQRMFAGIAGRYDLLNTVLSLGADRAWRRRAARLTGVGPGAAVVDVCTGTGALAAALRRRVGPSGRVTGVDFTAAMLEEARRRVAGVEFVQGDARALPLPSASQDAATMAFGLRNIDQPVSALVELRRVVRPGGRVVVLEFTQVRLPLVRGVTRWYLEHVLSRVAGLLLPRAEAYDYLAASISAFPRAEIVTGWLRAAGFRKVRVVRMTGGIVACHVARRPPG